MTSGGRGPAAGPPSGGACAAGDPAALGERLLAHLGELERELTSAASCCGGGDAVAPGPAAAEDEQRRRLALVAAQQVAVRTCAEALGRRRGRPEVRSYADWLLRQLADEHQVTDA